MLKRIIPIFLLFFASIPMKAQDSTDVKLLPIVKVSGSETKIYNPIEPKISLLQTAQIVSKVNSIPGVRMEQRSPGSYRMNIRGSSQRTPFGIRNIKFYLNEIPFTEPGGNTYFNQLNFRDFNLISFTKGPQSTESGAAMGGMVDIQTLVPTFNFIQLDGGIGSFGTWNSQISQGIKSDKYSHYLSISKEAANGYRNHSAMERSNILWTPSYTNKNTTLSGTFLYSDLWYQTPGGLTAAQYLTDRKAARPAAGAFPSAETANASIDQKNFLMGLTLHQKLSKNWTYKGTTYFSKLNLENPTFRNYEKRNEPHMGIRTSVEGHILNTQLKAGLEFQSGNYDVKTFNNENGNEGNLQTDDIVKIRTGFAYVNARKKLNNWNLELGYSTNLINTTVERNELSSQFKRSTDIPFMHLPKLIIQNESIKNLSISAIVSKGYSPPSSSEVLPSNSVINTTLLAEKAWNYELDLYYALIKKKNISLFIDVKSYIQNSTNTIVQRRDEDNADYFVNAGATQQKGLEGDIAYYHTLSSKLKFYINQSFNYTDYKFKDYQVLSDNYSQNRMPGNMRWNTYTSIGLDYSKFGKLNLTYSYNDKMYLNDANTFTSEPYRILSVDYFNEINLDKKQKHKIHYKLGIENLTNEFYSLGFDFNAAANRFYNAAPGIQYFLNLGYKYKF